MSLWTSIINSKPFGFINENVGDLIVSTASKIVGLFNPLCEETEYRAIYVLSVVITIIIGTAAGLLIGMLTDFLIIGWRDFR